MSNGNGTKATNSEIDALPKGFFAYASSPPGIPHTIRAAIQGINKTQNADIKSWEAMEVAGKYIVDEICEEIDLADFFCADVTTINPNVMFELGYAIAADKRVWLIRDESYTDAKKEFEQLRLLTTVGFSPYINSPQIIDSFFSEKPHLSLDATIFRRSIEPLLDPQAERESILYLKSRYDTEASLQITRSLKDSGLPLILSDPRETSVQPLYWYAQKLFESVGLVAHFVSPLREGFRLHNARYALVCGLAKGFDVKKIMLSEQSEMLAPMDYRDDLQYYMTPGDASGSTELWLEPLAGSQQRIAQIRASHANALRLATELKDFNLKLGEYIAENESSKLDEYFVETTVSSDIINGTQTVFVGRKGTGKTANLFHAESVISKDARSLVCLIKPVGYEIEGLVRLFSGYKAQDLKGYVIESLWKYMIYTELAQAAMKQISCNTLWEMTEPVTRAFVEFYDDEAHALSGDFTIRLERLVKSLELIPHEDSIEKFRQGISEALHAGTLSKLKKVLGQVLGRKRQVILLVDNLDKPWTRSADLRQLAEFLLGLLTAVSRIGEELKHGSRDSEPTKFNSAIFLRSDIFEQVLEVAREPDKVVYTRLRWDDQELLLRVVEERYVAAHGPESNPAEMWRKYFCPLVRGVPTRDYLSQRILKRPRDIIYLTKAVVSTAVNRKHDRVEERDIFDGEKQYSQYALDSILVENGITIPQLESVLFEFVGLEPVLNEVEVRQCISKVEIPIEKVDSVLDHLVKLSFLGVEIADGVFAYADEARELRKQKVQSDRFAANNRPRRYEINAPFRTYLEIAE